MYCTCIHDYIQFVLCTFNDSVSLEFLNSRIYKETKENANELQVLHVYGPTSVFSVSTCVRSSDSIDD